MTHADDSIVRVIADELEQKGFMNIRVLEGGMLGWEAAALLQAVELT